jgi:NADPH:quinone reductase
VVEHRLRPVSGERLLVVGGASAVGAYCIQLGKAAGAHVTASSSAASFAYLREFGADEVVDVREPGGWSRAHAVAPRGFDAAVDVYGPQSAAEILQHLRFGGRLACCVGAPVFGPDRPFPRGLSLHDILFSGAPLVGDDGPQDDWRPIGESLAGRIAAGELRAAASEVIAFDAIPAALEAMRDGRSRVRYVARLT